VNAAKKWRLRNRRIAKYGHLPCAGITLIRFYGYHLSRSAYAKQHPEELRKYSGRNVLLPDNKTKISVFGIG
jgi:hypothetical protein